jgi:hypothetical protein
MKRVTYAGETFVTTDPVADALVDYAAALGRSGRAEVVELPAVDDHGEPHQVRLVIGPASQMSAVDVETEFTHLEVGDTVARLQTQARTLEQPNVAAMTSAPITSIFDDEEFESP